MGAAYTCPTCKQDCSCDCKNCKDNPSYGEPIIWDGDFATCPNCLTRNHIDMWEAEELNQIDLAMSKIKRDE